MSDQTTRTRRLIEEWLPIAEIGIEGLRERTPMTPFPAPNRLHVWFARRPLVASRAAVLASLLPAEPDTSAIEADQTLSDDERTEKIEQARRDYRARFLHILGIHGDPVAAKQRMAMAAKNIDPVTGKRENLGPNPYGYDRAFKYSPSAEEFEWIMTQVRRLGIEEIPTVLDPTAGGGSIPFEAVRLGFNTIANDLNPVAWLLLKATVEFPKTFGPPLLKRYNELAKRFKELAEPRFAGIFPEEPEGVIVDGYLWARTIRCPYCEGLVPLSPNWKLDGKGAGVRLVPRVDDPLDRRCGFEIVTKAKEHSAGTVKGGDALCPFPDCGRVIDGDEIKTQAQAGQMGQQLYAVVFKRRTVVSRTKAGKDKVKMIRGFRVPRPEDDVEDQIHAALEEKRPEWELKNIIPTEERYIGPADRSALYGVFQQRDLFSPRQLYGHGIAVDSYHHIINEISKQNVENLSSIDRAALVFIAFALDKVLNYNAIMVRWHSNREVVAGTFDRHDFSFKWSYAEIASYVTGSGYDWAFEQTGKALNELIELVSSDVATPLHDINLGLRNSVILNRSGDDLGSECKACSSIVIDPPYYDNVMYAELSDFFYVWLKRTAGLLFPEQFSGHLTDKDREAVANFAKFRGMKGTKELSSQDYEERMASIFRECRSKLEPVGTMVVMFTHKSSGAWDALAGGLVKAGFVITASWPVNTEAEGSLHIKEKAAAKSTIFLVCRAREAPSADAEAVYWEDIAPRVAARVRERIGTFQEAGIGGIDLYLACFGPALEVFSESWPLTRGRPRVAVAVGKGRGQKAKLKAEADAAADPYAVRPEDALDEARRVVKQWRMEQLATVKRQGSLDPLTEWYVLAWDAFKAPKFPFDEALRLARVVGLDLDRDVKNRVAEVKGSDVTLWDSKTRRLKGTLGSLGGPVILDTLHHAAALGREQNTGTAREALEQAGMLDDNAVKLALEALLNVLPPASLAPQGTAADPLTGFSADFAALNALRRLCYEGDVPAPKDDQLLLAMPSAAADARGQPEFNFQEDQEEADASDDIEAEVGDDDA